jgi:putative Mg2+ transporter-C (MgtC) family protein
VEWDILARIILATVVGFAIGLENEARRAEGAAQAGPRTFALVALGAALITATAGAGSIGSVIAGIGFLGAGLVIQGRGAYAAALIWATGALGAILGAGKLQEGILSAVLVLLVLESDYLPGRRRMEEYLRTRFRQHGQDWRKT